jgi:hypothetical protein
MSQCYSFSGSRNPTQTVVVPHIDKAAFGEGYGKAGYRTQPFTDAQALLIKGILRKRIWIVAGSSRRGNE